MKAGSVYRDVGVVPRGMEVDNQPWGFGPTEALKVSLQPDILLTAFLEFHIAPQVYDMRSCKFPEQPFRRLSDLACCLISR